MIDDRELSALMRDGMAAEARQVSATAGFTEQLITRSLAEADPDEDRFDSRRTARAWQAWVLPAAAAVLVALLASSVLIGARLLQTSHSQPGNSVSPAPVQTTPAPTTAAPSTSAPPSSPAVSGGAPVAAPTGPAGGAVPAGFRVSDLTWVSTDEGWALGTAPCAAAPCTSIVRTTDGGKNWVGIPAPRAELFGRNDCVDNCVSHLRFANRLIGYAFGPSALYLTTDGSVLRVVSQGDCAPGCNYRLQRSDIGSDTWTDVAIPSGGRDTGVDLVRTGKLVLIATHARTAGGAQHATSVLFVSGDDGASWRNIGEPCPQSGTAAAGKEVDTRAEAIAPDGSITVLCSPRGTGAQFTMTSTDGGAHFTAAPPSLGAAPGTTVAAASATVLLVSSDQLYRSTDSGRHWSRVQGGGKSAPASAAYLGFENSDVGRAVTDKGASNGPATIWTTTDGGSTWTSHTFG